MKQLNTHSVRKKAFKITTDSNRSCSAAPNPLQHKFNYEKPNQVWIGDITYIPTGEG